MPLSDMAPERRSIELRRVVKKDLEAITVMLDAMIRSSTEGIDYGWLQTGDAKAFVEARLEKQLAFIALHGSKAVGFLSWKVGTGQLPHTAVRYSQIDGLWVIKQYRRHGLGRALWAQYLQECSRQAIRDIRITVPARTNELPFFESLGFVHSESLLTYRGPREAASTYPER